jgi:hypothetical protein
MKAFLLVLLAAIPGFSQSTWGGLRFGMTPAQARLSLKDRPMKDRIAPANLDMNRPETFFIDVQDVAVGQHNGTAHLQFSKDHKLVEIELAFTRTEEGSRGCFSRISTEEAVTRSLTVTEISEKMLERFGKPVSETGVFPNSQDLASYYARGVVTGFARVIEGKRIWRTEGQVIEEWFHLPCGSLYLFVSYRPQTKEL